MYDADCEATSRGGVGTGRRRGRRSMQLVGRPVPLSIFADHCIRSCPSPCKQDTKRDRSHMPAHAGQLDRYHPRSVRCPLQSWCLPWQCRTAALTTPFTRRRGANASCSTTCPTLEERRLRRPGKSLAPALNRDYLRQAGVEWRYGASSRCSGRPVRAGRTDRRW